MKSILKVIIGFLPLFLLFFYFKSCEESKKKNKIEFQELVQKSLDKDDYASAYDAIDAGIADYDTQDLSYNLNEKALKQEVTSLIDSDEAGNNAARIVYAIGERSKYNSSEAYSNPYSRTKEIGNMYVFALNLAQTLGKTELTEKLQECLERNKIEEEKERKSEDYIKDKEETAIAELSENVQKALDEQDFKTAYRVVDAVLRDNEHTNLRDKGHFLNEKILSQQIIYLIEQDENGSNAPQIISAITDRAKFNDAWSRTSNDQEKKMYQTAITKSKMVEKKQLTKKLKKALDDL